MLRAVRVVRCFSFLDLCGFTTYTDVNGDREAVAVLAQLRANLRADAEERGVRVTKWLGDGAMLSGVDTADVIACTLDVHGRNAREGALPLRAGIACGAVIMFEGDDYIGAPVNAAARLCTAAAPGQILAATACTGTLPPRVVATPRDAISLPGLAAPVAVAEIAGAG